MDLNATVNPDDFVDGRQSELDRNLLVRFLVKPRQDKSKSIEEGRPIFTDCEYIEIRIPGSRDAICRPARHGDIERFGEHYRRFKDRIAEPVEGTPLGEWPVISRAMAEELSFQNIKTVEALSEVADSLMSGIRGLSQLKRKAKDWLELAKNDAPLEHLNAELSQRDATISAQTSTIEQLTIRMEAMEKALAKPKNDPLVAGVLDAMPDMAPAPEPEPEETTLSKRRRVRAEATKE